MHFTGNYQPLCKDINRFLSHSTVFNSLSSFRSDIFIPCGPACGHSSEIAFKNVQLNTESTHCGVLLAVREAACFLQLDLLAVTQIMPSEGDSYTPSLPFQSVLCVMARLGPFAVID